MARSGLSLWLVMFMYFCLCMGGCAARPNNTNPSYQTEPWDPRYPKTHCLVTEHYRIYTDFSDRDDLDHTAEVMEAAYRAYNTLWPIMPSDIPMRCFIFSNRGEWAAFTRKNAGQDAAVYLKINRGAYTVDDWFVAFWLGDQGTWSIIAHEGWHQFVARHCIGRLPPALEEGFACRFENIQWPTDDSPYFDIHQSRARSQTLADAIASNRLWPLHELIRVHAGDVIYLPREKIETFYAQSWAMSLFLLESYPSETRRYLADVAAGRAYRPAAFANLKPNQWNPNLGQAQFEHYFERSMAEIERDYTAYCYTLSRTATWR